jgi:hypothetical protein
MEFVLWQAEAGQSPRTATVRGAFELGVPNELVIRASVSTTEDLRGSAAYIQLEIPSVGPALAWVGVPGGGQRDGHFVHPASGRSWPWGELRHAVVFAIEYVGSALNPE